MNLEVPEEFLREEQVAEVYRSYKELQSQFKATHSHVEQDKSRMNPSDLQREVQQLDAEREQLAQKIQLLKAKTERDEGFAQLLQVTSMLRKEQEEEARLAEKLQEQKYQLEQTERAFRCFRPVLQTSAFQHFQEQLYIERSARLREMREAQMHEGEGSAEAMFKMLSTEVIKSREALARVSKEREEKIEQLRDMDSTLSEPPVRQVDIDNLENEIQAMQNEIHSHTEKISEQNQEISDVGFSLDILSQV
eukprot:g15135.t1